MAKYELFYYPTHLGASLWSLNVKAREKYGYFIDINELPLSEQTKADIRDSLQEFDTRVDWDRGKKQWTWLDERRFKRKAKALCQVVSIELGLDYIIRSDRKSIVSGIRSAFREIGVAHTDIFEHYFTACENVVPYYDRRIEETNYEDIVFRGHHYRAVVDKTGGVADFMPLDKYTPNFHPEELKEIALSAEPYDLSAPEIKMRNSKDPKIQARRKATFARLSLKEHYGTDDMSKWV